MTSTAAIGMAYVNHPRPESTEPASKFAPFEQISSLRLHPQWRMWLAVGLAAFLAGLVALLALAPPYSGLAAELEFQPARLLAPLHTYLFRNAVINTGWLLAGVYLVALPLGWTWAITGIPPWTRPLLLLPLLIPGALVGLLWRPLFAGLLDLAQMELSLAVTGVVLLWRIVPLAAWLFSRDRDAWPKFIPLCSLPILLDGDLILTLTRGEPFNASHTWPSWMLQQLWVSRAWGYAASMAAALALVAAFMTWWASLRTASPIAIPHGSPIGLIVAILWLLGPFLVPLAAFVRAPLAAINTLVDLGAPLWLLNGALLWSGATLLAMALAWRASNTLTRLAARIITVALLPIITVAIAYLVAQLPLLGSRWLLLGLIALLTAGLLTGDEQLPLQRSQWGYRAAGYAMLVIAHSFPLQLVMHLPAPAWSPAMGIVWTLAEARHAAGALGLALLLFGLWAGLGAWLVGREKDS